MRRALFLADFVAAVPERAPRTSDTRLSPISATQIADSRSGSLVSPVSPLWPPVFPQWSPISDDGADGQTP